LATEREARILDEGLRAHRLLFDRIHSNFTHVERDSTGNNDAQPLTVYAVLEDHRSLPFRVSPPRETRGRIGRVALLSLTDNGKEFKGVLAADCERLGIRSTRTKPRHAWTNGFVERLQKTIPDVAGPLSAVLQLRADPPRLSRERAHAGDYLPGSYGGHEPVDRCVNSIQKLDMLVRRSELIPATHEAAGRAWSRIAATHRQARNLRAFRRSMR
jgi:transposase InsO family protein